MPKTFVLIDLEWIICDNGKPSDPTQLAAIRTNESWETVDTFSSLIRPECDILSQPVYCAFNGHKKAEFLDAPKMQTVLSEFCNWLTADDIICWWYSTGIVMFREILDRCSLKNSHRQVVITDYLREYIPGHNLNIYKVARMLHIAVATPMHCSVNDVNAIRENLYALKFDPNKFDKEPVAKFNPELGYMFYQFPYVLDKKTSILHKTASKCFDTALDHQGFMQIRSAVKQGFKVCPICLKEEYINTLKEQCKKNIANSPYNYIFLPNSKVFHLRNCKAIRTSTTIQGTQKYETALRKGRKPCKLCKPVPNILLPESLKVPDATPPKPVKPKKQQKEYVPRITTLSAAERARALAQAKERTQLAQEQKHALSRLKQAKNERTERLHSDISKQERKDILVLTQPGYVFWASMGYKNFHLRNCPNLSHLSNLKGFAKYSHARSAGYIPCRKCNPSPKDDIVLSMPITTEVRDNESIDDIIEICQDCGFDYKMDDFFFYIETPVGKWRINMSERPIILDHINTSKNMDPRQGYHRQPRTFLSITDTVLYIRRHDFTIISGMTPEE